MNIFAFSATRLEARKDDIKSMLSQLPEGFFVDSGGGMTLMNAVVTRQGVLWGEQSMADHLFALGSALGLCKYCFPRALWSSLPDGLPYFVVNLNGFKKEIKK